MNIWTDEFSNLLEQTLSPDGNISNIGILLTKFYVIMIVLALTPIAMSMLPSDRLWGSVWLVWTPVCVMHFSIFLLWPFHMEEDGFFENATVIVSLVAVLCFISLYRRFTPVWILALVWFVFAMEEISWGQRIFGWDSHEMFAQINYQNETNLHNLAVLMPFNSPNLRWIFWLILFSVLFFDFRLRERLLKFRFIDNVWSLIQLGREGKLWLILLVCTVVSFFEALREEYIEQLFSIYGLVWAYAIAVRDKDLVANEET